MDSVFRYVAPPSPCSYLPEQLWSLEYELVRGLTAAEYQARLLAGWRRFGAMLFRPRCRLCRACQSLRVVVERFRPDRSQRRAARANDGDVEVRVGPPRVTRARLALYDRFHAHQVGLRDWPQHPAKDAQSYVQSFVDNPFPTQEWTYYLGGELIGVGYVDDLAAGPSAIYFFYEPALRQRSLGTWNVLNLIRAAADRGLAHVYLGYYVSGCVSMEYKARFVPNQVLGPDGEWRDFLT